MNTGLTFTCGAIAAFLGMFAFCKLNTVYGDAVSSKKRIYPDIEIVIKNGKSDTTFIYRKWDK